MFLRQFGSELVSPRHENASSVVPGDLDWASPRSSANGGGGGGRRRRDGGFLSHSAMLQDPSDESYNEDALGSRERRTLTAEFGSGSDTNPALFGPSNTGRRATAAPGRKNSSGESGGSGEGGSLRRGRWVLDSGGRRGWVDDRSDLDSFGSEGRGNAMRGAFVGDPKQRDDDDDDDASMRAAATAAAARKDSSLVGDGSASADDGKHSHGRGHEREHEHRHALPGDRGGRHHHHSYGQPRSKGGGEGGGERLGVGRDVVDGYVSLGSHQTHRRGPDEDRGGGLLLPRPPPGGGQGVRGPPGGGPESALSLFRKQLYEEGRGKGTLASM